MNWSTEEPPPVMCHRHPDRVAAVRTDPLVIGEPFNMPLCRECRDALPPCLSTWPVDEIRIARDSMFGPQVSHHRLK